MYGPSILTRSFRALHRLRLMHAAAPSTGRTTVSMTEEQRYDPHAEYTFRGRTKIGPNGEEATLTHIKETPSSSGVGKYFTMLWSDGMLSCDCRGWTVKKKGKARDCKHCRASRQCNHDDLTPVATFQSQAPVSYEALEERFSAQERQASGIRIRRRRRHGPDDSLPSA